MAGNARGLSLGHFRVLYDAGTAAGLTDGQLLERFATRRDEASELAFAALVERHGPMVLRACGDILQDRHEAMDAFQATFFVLARKANSLWVQDSLGPWLHRVACRAAIRARGSAARRRAVEKQAAQLAIYREAGDVHDDLATVIHEEIDRLPERYRLPIVLCDLEGLTCEQAAQLLNCPIGTIGSRLSRGRQRLRDRLRHQGLAPRTGLLVGALPGPDLLSSIPPGLVGSTADAAVQFVTTRASLPEGARILALEVLSSMAMNPWWKVASILVALGTSTSVVMAFASRDAAVADPQADAPPNVAQVDDEAFLEVMPGKLSVVAQDRGSLEPSHTADVYNKVEGPITIISLQPEGARVKKDDLVCELDSATLRDTLTNQVIATEGANAAYLNAKMTREVAEIGLKEYEEGIYLYKRLEVSNEIERTQSAIAKAEARLKRVRAARERVTAMTTGQGGLKSPADVVAMLDLDDRLDDLEQLLDREQKARDIALAKRGLLEIYSKVKTVKELRRDIEKALLDEIQKKAVWEFEHSKQAKLERQIKDCRLLAPRDGMIIYANDPARLGNRPRAQIEEGGIVRERQKIFSIIDLQGPMRVNAKFHESKVSQIGAGLPARIQVDMFPNENFKGVVQAVAPLPDPSTLFDTNVKVYTVWVDITNGIPNLRPGMTAKVEVMVADLDKVLSVPVEATVRYDQKDHVAVRTAAGEIEWREVTLGLTDGHRVEVKEGLKPGEKVALKVEQLLSEEQKQKVANSPPKPVVGIRAKGKAASKLSKLSAALRAKLLAMPREDRAKLPTNSPKDREAILRNAGLTDDEVKQVLQMLEPTDLPH